MTSTGVGNRIDCYEREIGDDESRSGNGRRVSLQCDSRDSRSTNRSEDATAEKEAFRLTFILMTAKNSEVEHLSQSQHLSSVLHVKQKTEFVQQYEFRCYLRRFGSHVH